MNLTKVSIILIIFFLPFSGFYLGFLASGYKSNNRCTSIITYTPTQKPTATPAINTVTNEVMGEIVTDSITDNKVNFIVQANSPNGYIKNITYWTDKIGSCQAQIQPYSQTISIPTNQINKWVYVMFTDNKNKNSPIYAESPEPIFQCGQLTE